jgi:REP element-mobilizing transposase RayT
MIRKPETTSFWRGHLPHWEVADGRYFITIHLRGAIPDQGHQRIRAISSDLQKLSRHDDDGRLKVQRRIFAEMEAWLDRAAYVDHLRDSRVAASVREAVEFREGRDWHIFEYVIMPNHVHLFLEVIASASPNMDEPTLKNILQQFKRWTGHEAARILSLNGERFWQEEWFDHWSRSDEEDERICAYIRRNPEKAGLVKDYRDWPYGSWK